MRRREYEECLLKGSVLGRRPPAFELLETLRWTPDEGFFLLDRHLAACATRPSTSASRSTSGGSTRLSRCGRAAADGATARAPAAVARRAPSGSKHGRCTLPRRRVQVRLATAPVEPGDVFLFHKTTNRAVYDRPRGMARGADDVILWNATREVTEATTANVVVEHRRAPGDAAGRDADCWPGRFAPSCCDAARSSERR